MNRAEESSLAWALADSAVFLRADARAWLCAKIGAGDLDSAIRDLLHGFVRHGAELPRELAVELTDWLRGYSGSDFEPALRDLVDRVRISERPVQSPQVASVHRRKVPPLTATRRWPLNRKSASPAATP